MAEFNLNMDPSRESTFIKLLVSAQPRIFGYLVTLLPSISDAEEVMQETSMVMWSKFDEFASANELADKTVDDLVTWGNQIAYFKVLNLRRRKDAKTKQLSENIVELISEEWTKQEQSQALELRRQALKTCVNSLSAAQREILEGYYWQKSSVSQIAEHTERTVAGVYKLLQRIRESLHSCINSKLAQES